MNDTVAHRWLAFSFVLAAAGVFASCGSGGPGSAAAQAPAAQATSASSSQPSDNRQAEFGRFPNREFIRRNLDKLTWSATEGNKLGVQSAVLEGDPSKPGFYLIVNRFPPGVMSRPHTHPDERHVVVLKGTWYTGEGESFTPDKTTPLKPGDYMRHPAGGPHFDGGLDEEVFVLISGYGPTRADVIGGGDLFAPSRPAK
jgi:quercetin dioxygenase-like cupin family protein